MNDPNTAKTTGSSLVREVHGSHAAVGYIELFFDLVFVFAITQLSHGLLEHLSWMGALQTGLLFLAVWWAWIYTTWATNWINPDHGANRLVLGVLMIISLVLASAIPKAFAGAGLTFAVGYVVLQIGRSLYTSWVCGEWKRDENWSLVRVTIWFAASAPLWVIGGLSPDPAAQMACWGAALAIESVGPLFFYRVPGLGRSTLDDWAIIGGHMAERCALFIIIALGEGVLITGATFGRLDTSPATIAAFLTAFLGSFAMWWVYFDVGARRGAEHIEHHEHPGLVGRDAFTYWHVPIVAGIILLAVTDELTLAHPLDPVHGDFLVVATGGMALFLIGTMTFKRISSGNPWFPPSHSFGLWLTAALALWGWRAHPQTLIFYMGSVAVFAVVALWEWGSYHGGWVERMERRNWWLGRMMRRYTDWRLVGLNRRRKS